MRIVIVGGGPAGYEAALMAAQLDADVVVVDRDGIGGACVLDDCVPSKTLIATSEALTSVAGSASLGVRLPAAQPGGVSVDLPAVNRRVKELARAQSADIGRRLAREGVQVVEGSGRLLGGGRVVVTGPDGSEQGLGADVVLVATGASPRVLPGAVPDGERILDWREVYELTELPEHLVVVGSGVTGAEFANAYQAMGVPVTWVSSRDRVMPSEDADAARLLEDVFTRRGMRIMKNARAQAVTRTDGGVLVELTDGRRVEGSHALMAVGSVPNTGGMGLPETGVTLTRSGHVQVDRVSRTTAPNVYAAGDVTGVLPLASVAAMQGRIAVWHALGEAVTPLRLSTVASNVFTDPEIATVGVADGDADVAGVRLRTAKLPLATNARAKMQGVTDGFVKLFCRPGTGTVLGGVVVAPRASELILPVSIAVQHGLTVDQLAHTFSIYPSLTGSLVEAARTLTTHAPG